MMKGITMYRLLRVFVVALSLFAANTLLAQKGIKATIPEITPGDIEFKIKDVKIDEILYKNDSAFLELNRVKGSTNASWGAIVVEYEWKLSSRAKASTDQNYWLDTLTFDWKVVLANNPQGGLIREMKPYYYSIHEEYAVRMARSVTYKNVSDDDSKFAVILVDDKTITRYLDRFNKTNVFVELKIKLNEAELGTLNVPELRYREDKQQRH